MFSLTFLKNIEFEKPFLHIMPQRLGKPVFFFNIFSGDLYFGALIIKLSYIVISYMYTLSI